VDAQYLFDGCTNITSVTGLDNRYFPNLTAVCKMLPQKVTHLSIKNLEAPKLEQTYWLFTHLDSLEELDISGMSTPATELGGWQEPFTASGRTMKKLIANNLKMPNLISIRYTFSAFTVLETLELSFEECGEIEYAESAFNDCAAETIDIRTLNLSKTIYANSMFKNCGAETIRLGSMDSVTYGNYMFTNCTSLKTLESGYIRPSSSRYDTFSGVSNVELKYNDTKESLVSSFFFTRSNSSAFSQIVCTDGEYALENN
jgi:hypothetical protein